MRPLVAAVHTEQGDGNRKYRKILNLTFKRDIRRPIASDKHQTTKRVNSIISFCLGF